MILDKEVEITVNSATIKHFKNLGYDAKRRSKLLISIEHLNNSSNYGINVKCDICGNISFMSYKLYNRAIKYNGNYYCRENKCFTEKVKLSTLEKYGVTNTSQLIEKQDIWKKTNMDKYGFENVFQVEEVKIKLHKTQNHIPESELEGFKLYTRITRKLTLRNKKELIKYWDGYDYYDNEYIKDNFNLNHNNENYPSIDHKICIKTGYLTGLSENYIANLNNLCITKKKINSKKKCKSEEDYKKTLLL